MIPDWLHSGHIRGLRARVTCFPHANRRTISRAAVENQCISFEKSGLSEPRIRIRGGRKALKLMKVKTFVVASMLALANGFIMLNALSSADTLEHRAFFVLPARWNQNRDGLADCFFGGIAK